MPQKETVSRQAKWAQRKRAELMWILGDRCAHCPATKCLTFDCIVPRGGAHHKMSSSQRMTFYAREMRAGNLQILCADCNVKKSNKHNGLYRPSVLPTSAAESLERDEFDELMRSPYKPK